MRVADHILSLSSAQIAPRQLDTAITVLMLLPSGPDEGPDVGLGHEGIRKGCYRIDSRLVAAILDATRSTETQRSIVGSAAFVYLPRPLFRRLFFRFWRRRRGNAWRWTMGWALHSFLHDKPGEARFYAQQIWTIASDPDETVALAGLANTKYLGGALTLKQAETLVAMTHHNSNRASAAASNLGTLYRDLKSLRPEVRALLLDPKTIDTLRSANPPDGRGKWSCYRWCLTNMHKALRRARGRRAPRAVR